MRRAFLFALGLVIAVIGIAAFIAVLPAIQPKPQSKPVSVTLGVVTRNSAGGCLNLASVSLAILRLDGSPLNPNNTTILDIGANSTTITLMSGSTHVISANQSYTGECNGCAECRGAGNSITAFFSDWESLDGVRLSASNTYEFEVPSNGSSSFVAAYTVG
jgi:hypothetical protein